MEGRIIKIISNQYTVLSDNTDYLCNACGKFRNLKQTPLVGDFVVFDEKQNYIKEILPRKNTLVRPPVSNIDSAIIVTSTHIPAFSSNLLDKQLCIIEFNNIIPVICISKYDLLDNTKEMDEIVAYYKKIGYKVFINTQIEDIKKIFKDNVTILTGQTGVGKSSLINKLEKSMDLKTGEISKALGRGKHTTRHTELFELFDGYVADTPGFSSLNFIGMNKEDIRDNFIEFNEYKDKCKYRDCMHVNEDDCEIKRRVSNNEILKSRYDNYVKFILEKRE